MRLKFLHIWFLLLYLGVKANPPGIWEAMIGFPQAEVLSENTVRIPFSLADHLIVLEGEINGQTGNLILDTGSKHLVLNKAHFNHNPAQLRRGTGYAVNGTIDQVMAQRIQSFNFSTFNLPKTTADLLDLSHIENNKKTRILGIIGYDILLEYEVYIDFYLQQVTLFRTDKNGDRIDKHLFTDTPETAISFLQQGHSIIINTFLNDVPLRMALDTGAEINFLDLNTSKKALKGFRGIKPVKLKGMHKSQKEILAGKVYGLKVPELPPVGVMRTLLADLREMTQAYGTPVDGVLGYEFIAMKRFLINYKKKAIIFVKSPYSSTKS